ncbi:DUF4871 domain-containing protein [Sporosarcina sp. Marseille-Q4943]|uniref:DUF4871 domain-containing protein n=1 Tax=Sporosarcina sp. Marseille-Q4943 TaxID=2942204 RepID=UPI00208DBAC9|nr:DUF4871 domain-containing protein [Sporosarcina sp. Marseille-Q4943]
MKKIILGLLLTVFLAGCSEGRTVVQEEWEVSPTFEIPITFGNGTKGTYVLIGEEGRLGFLIGSGNEGEVEAEPIIKGIENKYMWHFWGKDEELNGNFKVIGINEEGEEHKVLLQNMGMPTSEKVWEYPNMGLSSNNGADTHIPSGMEFQTSGLWKLKVYFDENFFGEIVVNVVEG